MAGDGYIIRDQNTKHFPTFTVIEKEAYNYFNSAIDYSDGTPLLARASSSCQFIKTLLNLKPDPRFYRAAHYRIPNYE